MRIPSLFSLPMAILLAGVGFLLGCRPSPPPDSHTGSSGSHVAFHQREIVALGRLRPFDGIVSVSAIPGERLAILNVDEGDSVKKIGMSLGKLASHELHSIEVVGLQTQLKSLRGKLAAESAVADARVKQAEAAFAQSAMKRDEIALQKADIALLNDRVEMAKADLARLTALASDDPELVTVHEIERRELAFKQLASEFDQSQKKYDHAVKVSALGIQATQADLDAANAAAKQVRASGSIAVLEHKIAAAEVKANWSELPAPCIGAVVRVFLEPGEFVSQTPILQIADISKMACVAEVYEADIQWISVGAPVVLESAAFCEEFAKNGIRGRVDRIGNLIGPPEIQSLNPMARTDRHVVEVLISIDPEDIQSTAEASRLIGLQVSVRFVHDSADGRD